MSKPKTAPRADHGNQKSTSKTARTVPSRLYEVGLLIVFAITLFLLLALLSYHSQDPGWSVSSNGAVQNWGGGEPVLGVPISFFLS